MSWTPRHDRNLTRKESEARRPPADPSRGAAATGLPAVRARTGASGRRRRELAQPPPGLSTLTRAPKTRLRPSLATPSPSRARKSPRKGREGGRRGGKGGAGERPYSSSPRSPRALLVGTLAGSRPSLPPPHSGSPSPLSPRSPRLPSPPSLPAARLLPSPSSPSLAAAAAVAAPAEPEMGRERARRSSSGYAALPARSCPRPRRRCRRLGVPRLQSRS